MSKYGLMYEIDKKQFLQQALIKFYKTLISVIMVMIRCDFTFSIILLAV